MPSGKSLPIRRSKPKPKCFKLTFSRFVSDGLDLCHESLNDLRMDRAGTNLGQPRLPSSKLLG